MIATLKDNAKRHLIPHAIKRAPAGALLKLLTSKWIYLETGNRVVEVALELGPGLGTLRTSHRAASTEHAA